MRLIGFDKLEGAMCNDSLNEFDVFKINSALYRISILSCLFPTLKIKKHRADVLEVQRKLLRHYDSESARQQLLRYYESNRF